MSDSYGKLIIAVHKAFEKEPDKAGALAGILNDLSDRIRDLENQVADLKSGVGGITATSSEQSSEGGAIR